ncbi:MAG: hypothetical protein Kow0060_18190 [Methylohalobius crimeensis]
MNRFKVLSLLGCLVPGLAAAEAVTGKIVIDGVEYGNQDLVRGNHRRTEETRELPCFERIAVEAGIDVVYRPGKPCQARLEADSNLLDLVQTRVLGDQLRIEVKRSIQSEGPLRIELRSPRLKELAIRSAADVELLDLDSPRFRIEASGSGDVYARGRTGTLEIIAGGSGSLDFSRLRAEQAQVNVSGAADVAVNAQKTLKVDVSGVGDVTYYGRPAQVITHITGVGDVEAAE